MDICNFLIRATSSEWGSRNWVVGSAIFAHYVRVPNGTLIGSAVFAGFTAMTNTVGPQTDRSTHRKTGHATCVALDRILRFA